MGLIEKPDALVLACYQLADIYHQNPEVFLAMPIDRLREHWHWTIKARELRHGAD